MLMPVMGSVPFSPGLYASDIRVMCKMTRIRKLLEDAQANPTSISTFLQEQLSIMVEDFPAVHEEYVRSLKKKSGNRASKQLPEVSRYRLLSSVAVYVLSEISDYDSLPLLAKISTQGRPRRSADLAGNCLVNRKFLLYGMHQLVRQIPEYQLSKEARKAREEYLVMAERLGIPDSRKLEVAGWNAYYHKDDFRETLPGKTLYSENQSTIELTVFPSLMGLDTRETERLLSNIRTFVNQRFPNNK